MSNGLFPPTKRDRRARVKKLENALKGGGDYKATIAKFALEEGVSLRTVREYLKFLKLAGKISEEIEI